MLKSSNSFRYIEFFGAPGVGKSTLFNNFISNNKIWIDSNSAKNSFLKNMLFRQYGSLKVLLLRIGFLTPFLSKLLYKSMAPSIDKMLIDNFISKYKGFFQDANSTILNSNSTENRKIMASRMLLNSMKDYSLFDLTDSTSCILTDESFCQRVYTQLSEFDDADESDIVKEYLDKIPLPNGVIYIESSSEKIMERVLKRYRETGQMNYMHQNLSDEKLLARCNRYRKYAKLGIEVIADKGVPILVINNNNLKKNISMVRDFIESQHG